MRNLQLDLWSQNLIESSPWDSAWNCFKWENSSYKSITVFKYLLLCLIFKFVGLQGKKKKNTKKQVAVFLGQDQEEERGSVP